MRDFELTERGKIIIAIILVLLLLVIPAIAILAVSSCRESPPGDGTPVITKTPLPAPGNGVTPSDPQDTEPPEPPEPPTESTPDPTPSPTPQGGNGDTGVSDAPPEYGPVGFNLTEGTMEFVFAPDDQDELDAETIDMIKEFLSSPMNVSGSKVKVDMPHISDEDETILITAVTKAFAGYGIGRSGLEFAKGGEIVEVRYFEVALSFTEPVKSTK